MRIYEFYEADREESTWFVDLPSALDHMNSLYPGARETNNDSNSCWYYVSPKGHELTVGARDFDLTLEGVCSLLNQRI